MRVEVPLRRSYRLINHGPTTLVTSAANGRRNVMAAAWVVVLDYDPPKVAAVIASDAWTRELVDASGEFVLNLPTVAMLDATYGCGSVTGRDEDKFARFGLKTAPASKVSAPLVEGCVAWLECKVLPEPHNQKDYDLFVAEVVAAWADDEVFKDGEWDFSRPEKRTLHHLASGTFFATGEKLQARKVE